MGPSGGRCDQCGTDARYGIEDRCRACNFPAAHWAPNVQLATQQAQTAALEERYEEACANARTVDALARLEALRAAARRTAVVVSMPDGVACHLLTSECPCYAPYAALVRANVRASASLDDDRQRRAIDSLLYGTYGEQITFGALTLDGRGPSSYGEVHAELKESTVAYRSTVLEENSYSFVQRHKIIPGVPWPKGYLASWADRDKLVVSKLGDKSATGEGHLAHLIMQSDGDRTRESFFEVHTYGTFNRQAIVGMRAPLLRPAGNPKASIQRFQRGILRERARSSSLNFVEE